MLNLTITRGFYQPRRHTQNRKYITIALPSEKDWSTATGNMYRKFVELGRAFLRYPIGAYKQTYRQVDRNTSPTYRGRSKERKYNTVHCVSKIKWLLITTFDDNFGKCRPIYKVFSLSDSWRNFVHIYHKDYPRQLKYVSILPVNLLQLLPSADFCDILHRRP